MKLRCFKQLIMSGNGNSVVLINFMLALIIAPSHENSLNKAHLNLGYNQDGNQKLKLMNTEENEQTYWYNKATNEVGNKINRKLNLNKAKNIIFFLGDGMSVPTVTAARIYQGQLHNRTGEEEKLFFETFPYTGLSKTYCVDSQIPDSACTATAYMCGVKNNIAAIGVNARVKNKDCEGAKQQSNRVESIVKWAQDAGKATGIITNTPITDASPAGSYAHVPHRKMQSDADILKFKLDPDSCNFDIAKQLVYEEPGKNLKVIMGGGRIKFLPNNNANSAHGSGERLSEDLIQAWKDDKKKKKANATYVTTLKELRTIEINTTDYLFGLFAKESINYNLKKTAEEPTLEEMTEYGIKMLQKEPNGFYLFVEGGRIDHGHHSAMAHIALDETIEFSKAIEKAYKLTNEKDTLIVVTADHAHTMSINGYSARGKNIFGLSDAKAKDGLPYSTLSYANGPGYRKEISSGVRYNLSNDNLDDIEFIYPGLHPLDAETHGGDDVAVYASGPWSHLFSGNYEQNYLPFAEAFAAGIGPAKFQTYPSSISAVILPGKLISFILILVILIC